MLLSRDTLTVCCHCHSCLLCPYHHPGLYHTHTHTVLMPSPYCGGFRDSIQVTLPINYMYTTCTYVHTHDLFLIPPSLCFEIACLCPLSPSLSLSLFLTLSFPPIGNQRYRLTLGNWTLLKYWLNSGKRKTTSSQERYNCSFNNHTIGIQ